MLMEQPRQHLLRARLIPKKMTKKVVEKHRLKVPKVEQKHN